MRSKRPPATPVSEPRAATREPDLSATDVGTELAHLARRIWEDQAIGAISTHYAHNAVLHLPDADHHGRESAVEHAMRTLATFPDLRMYGHEMVCGQDVQGGHSSHRVMVRGHHLGHALYGPPTGRRVQWREITQRLVVGGRVVEEWRVHDELSVIHQLGLDGWALARTAAQAEVDANPHPPVHTVGEVVRAHGQAAPTFRLDPAPLDAQHVPGVIAATLWNARRFDLKAEFYAPDAVIDVPGHRRLIGPTELSRYVLEWLAAFPDGALHIEHVTSTPDPGSTLAARWSFQGTHSGDGRYGPATGRRVRIPGITHYRVEDGRVQREDMVWNEFALLKQLCRPAGH